jgi:hypothetical protein
MTQGVSQPPPPHVAPAIESHTWARARALVSVAGSVVRRLRASFNAAAIRALAPAILPIAFCPFVAILIRLELKEPLFGDTAVFQYTGWCIRHGLKLYRDVGMADGPFIHYLHAAIQAFVGVSDRGFRAGDLVLQGAGWATMGALLAPTANLTPAARIASHAAWAATAALIWISWYFHLSWTETTEREAFYSLFGSLGLVLLYVSYDWTKARAPLAVFAGGFLTTTQVFGKATGVVYPRWVCLASCFRPRPSRCPERFV